MAQMSARLQAVSPRTNTGGADEPRYIACAHCSKAKVRCDKKVPCSRCASKQLVCEPRAARRSGHRSHEPLYRSLQPRKRAASQDDGSIGHTKNKSSSDDSNNNGNTSTNDNGTVPASAMMSQFPTVPAVYPGPTKTIPQQQQPQHQQEQQQQQQWTVGSLPITAGLPMDWLAQIPRHADQTTTSSSQPQLPVTAGNLERDSCRSHSTPLSMMDDLRDLNMAELNMTDLMGASGYDPLWEPYLPNSPGDNTGLTRDSHADWDSGGIGDHPSTSAQQPAKFFPSIFKPSSKHCFSQVRINLQHLEQMLRSQDQWTANWADADRPVRVNTQAPAEPITDSTRDQLLVVAQLLLQQSRSIHVRDADSISADPHPLNAALITLPPTKVLDDMIKAYCSNFDQYFKLCPGPVVRTNEILTQLPQHGKLGGILLLLMIAVGAAAIPSTECQHVAVGLTEMCRIAFSELLERDFSITTEPLVSYCALLLLYSGMWCGERWLMGISSAQKAMYVHLFRNATHLESFTVPAPVPGHPNVNQVWDDWKVEEFKSRLTYAWVMADQEWSLFYDTPNILSVDMLIDPMPTDDKLWKAACGTDFAHLQTDCSANMCQISLRDLYGRFINGELRVVRGSTICPLSLRLLLMPLQGMVCHLRQWLQTFSNRPVRWKRSAQALSNSAIHAQLDQVRGLLLEWFTLASHSSSSPPVDSPFALATLVIYHLVSLNTISGFPEIEEALANDNIPDRGSWNPSAGGAQAPDVSVIAQDSEEEVLFHCGQVLRLYRLMPVKDQPLWWPAVIYRVARILCFIALARHPLEWQHSRSATSSSWTTNSGDKDTSAVLSASNSSSALGVDMLSAGPNTYSLDGTTVSSSSDQSGNISRRFSLDNLPPDHPTLANFLKYKDGEPSLTFRDGRSASLKNPDHMFRYFFELLGHSPNAGDGSGRSTAAGTRLQWSVKSALEAMAERWGTRVQST